MNAVFRYSLFVLSLVFFASCEDASQKNLPDQKVKNGEIVPNQQKNTSKTLQVNLSKQLMNIVWQNQGKRIPEQIKLEDPAETSIYINGEFVKATNMPIDEFIKKRGKITLRAGKGFFADWSVELDIKDLKASSVIELNDFNTKAKVSIKKPNNNLPSSTNLNSVSGTLKTGKISNLGIPIQMHLEAKEAGKLPYIITGQGFATLGDIKIKDSRLDKHYDSFKTIRIIAKYFVKDIKRITPFVSRHVMYSSDKNIGVEALQVFSYQDDNKQDKLVRVQLLKEEEGWKPVKILKPWELLYSRKEARKKYTDELNVITSKKIEVLLENGKIENHLDTNVSCKRSKDKTQGLCTAKITVLQGDEKSCMTKAYSLTKKKGWEIVKEVATNLKLDYKTGKLIEKKNKKKSFEEKLLGKASGLLFGKCFMF